MGVGGSRPVAPHPHQHQLIKHEEVSPQDAYICLYKKIVAPEEDYFDDNDVVYIEILLDSDYLREHFGDEDPVRRFMLEFDGLE